jgi:hypothetical protein
MHFIKFLLCSIPIALVLEGAIVNSAAVAITPRALTKLDMQGKTRVSAEDTVRKQMAPPPPPSNPGGSAAGGRRDPSACPQDAVAPATSPVATSPTTTAPLLTALSPTTTPGLTLTERPTFLVYVPRTSAETAEFSLRDRESRGVYRTTIALTHTPDIISVSPPEQAMPLEIGMQYTWSFAVICNPNDRLEDRFVTGTVQRIELDSTRLQQIKQAPPEQRMALYQEDGIWYDALALLFELKRNQPNGSNFRTIWREFLQSAGADTMIDINSN